MNDTKETNIQNSKTRRKLMVEFAKNCPQPVELSRLANAFGFSVPTARAYLLFENAPFLSPRGEKKARMVSLHKQGLDCASIAKEMGFSSPLYVYNRLVQLGEQPVKPRGELAYFQFGTRKLNKDIPRLLKQLGDIKRGMDNPTLNAKYGICRERVSQLRAYGIATGLLDQKVEATC